MPEKCHTALLNESKCQRVGRHSPPSIVAWCCLVSRLSHVLRALPFASAPPPRLPSIDAWCHEARE